jgi:hypothetical protein
MESRLMTIIIGFSILLVRADKERVRHNLNVGKARACEIVPQLLVNLAEGCVVVWSFRLSRGRIVRLTGWAALGLLAEVVADAAHATPVLSANTAPCACCLGRPGVFNLIHAYG